MSPTTTRIDRIKELAGAWRKRQIVGEVLIDLDCGRGIAIVGSRIASTPGLAARMFTALAKVSVNIDCISTSAMKVSCVIGRGDLDQAVRAVHAEFFGTRRAATGRATTAAARKKPVAAAAARPAAKTPARRRVAR